MKIYNRTNHPPDQTSVFDNSFTRAYNQAEASNAINDLWLALEEARGVDECRIGHECDKLANLQTLLTERPCDYVAVVMAWGSFRLPMMVDGPCAAYERAVEAMAVLLSR